jgi:diguanylate cyclase (GGDEF)-like protein/PAS domain S-box-containing protein
MTPDEAATTQAAPGVPRQGTDPHPGTEPHQGTDRAPANGDYQRLLEEYRSGQEMLRQAETRFKMLVETIPGVAYLAAPAEGGEWHYISPRLRELLGFEPEEWIAEPAYWTGLLHPDDRDRVLQNEASWVELTEGVHVQEYRLRGTDGRYRWIRDAARAQPGHRPEEPVLWFGVMTDITESKDAEEALRDLAFTDTLTGLANRARLSTLLEATLGARTADSPMLALLLLDLDDFKSINDSLGHAVGDRVLTITAERLRAALRGGETVARFTGDEFAVILPRVDGESEALRTAERIGRLLRAPFDVGGRRTVLGASIGVAVAGATAVRAAELIRDADAAMYDAKRSGKNRCLLYDPAMHARALARLELKTDLNAALLRNELYLTYQPFFDLATERLAGFEALLRWRHPARGLVPPLDFVPLAEETGDIRAIGAWVLNEACRQARRWIGVGPGGAAPTINVNVSAVQVQDAGFVATVADALLSTGLEPERLVLEITEGVLLPGLHESADRLDELRELGVRIAIDDFGTGYSSLSYLQDLPVDILKIDKAFVEHLGSGRDDISMARVVVQIARALRLVVIGEGVERPQQVTALRELGCEFVQGFHFGLPLDGEDALALTRSP